MSLSVLLPLLAFVALVAVLVIALRWTGRVIADTREAEAYRRAVEDLALRVDLSLGGIIERVDAVRRHQVQPGGIDDNLTAALEAVHRYVAEVGALDDPPPTAARGVRMESELRRVERALEMIQHGCAILASSRGLGRHTEGETAIKRGYLNLLHAREAFAEQAAEIVETTAVDPRGSGRRRRA